MTRLHSVAETIVSQGFPTRKQPTPSHANSPERRERSMSWPRSVASAESPNWTNVVPCRARARPVQPFPARAGA